jgi:hypothetical protein
VNPWSTRRRPDTDGPHGSIPNAVKRADEFVRAARHPRPLGRTFDSPVLRSDRDGGGGLGRPHAVDGDASGSDQFGGLLPRSRQLPPDEFGIHPGAPRHAAPCMGLAFSTDSSASTRI